MENLPRKLHVKFSTEFHVGIYRHEDCMETERSSSCGQFYEEDGTHPPGATETALASNQFLHRL